MHVVIYLLEGEQEVGENMYKNTKIMHARNKKQE